MPPGVLFAVLVADAHHNAFAGAQAAVLQALDIRTSGAGHLVRQRVCRALPACTCAPDDERPDEQRVPGIDLDVRPRANENTGERLQGGIDANGIGFAFLGHVKRNLPDRPAEDPGGRYGYRGGRTCHPDPVRLSCGKRRCTVPGR